jgi:hypothetical protein
MRPRADLLAGTPDLPMVKAVPQVQFTGMPAGGGRAAALGTRSEEG